LRRILPILFFILLIAIQSQGQTSRITPGNGATDPIVKLYPNPATTYVTFDVQNNTQKGYSIQVYSFLGRKVFERQIVAQRTTIDLSEYNRGVYIYYLLDANGKITESGKFQVSK